MSNVTANLKPSKTITSIERNGAKWLHALMDQNVVVIETFDPSAPGHKRFTQATKEEVNTHLKAGLKMKFGNDPKRAALSRLPKITQQQLIWHNRGYVTLHVRSAWPDLLIRFDIDSHDGQTDGFAMVELVQKQVADLGGSTYWCDSTNGYSVYTLLVNPREAVDPDNPLKIGQTKPKLTKPQMYYRAACLKHLMMTAAKASGITSTLEVIYSYLDTHKEHDEDGVTISAEVANLNKGVKLPRFKTAEDLAELKTAALIATNVPHVNLPKPPPKKKMNRRSGKALHGAVSRFIARTDDISLDTRNCISRAMIILVGNPAKALSLSLNSP